MTSRACVLCLFLLVGAAEAAAQPAVFLVRHAERADAAGGAPAMTGADPDLSSAGRARADRLAAMLRDARITAIFTTEYKRTRQTAEPLAAALGLQITQVKGGDTAALVEKIKASAGNVLVVGHSNTLPAALEGLGVREKVTVADTEFDNLFVVAGPALVRLRY